VGYSYQWDDAQTDATIVTEYGMHKTIMNGTKSQDWFFPGRIDCLTCHNKQVGWSLGPETIQMNKAIAYPGGTTANQVLTLEHIGLFDAPVRTMPALLNPESANTPATLEARARSYMHANCAICHRPRGDYADIDMRFDVKLADTGLCDAPNKGDFGILDSKRITPGNPMKSVVYLRMEALTQMMGRMPQLATSVVDTAGAGVINSWIKSLTTCP
jgi:mono/diheme cytochrome c family protein